MKIAMPSCLALIAASLVPSLSLGQTVFVDEDFEGYATQGAFTSVWAPTDGTGLTPAGAAGTLTTAMDGPADQTGNSILGGAGVVNEHVDGFALSNPTGFLIQPTETESIVVRGDIFIDAEFGSTMRQTVGLRGDIFTRDAPGSGLLGTNFVEMGTWNGTVCAPTVGTDDCSPGDPDADPPVDPSGEFRAETDFGFRVQLFDFATLGNYFENGEDIGTMVRQPDWQYFPLKEELDLVDNTLPNGNVGNGDGEANLTDIGSGWHTFEATISDESITLTLDLFRDGLDNSTGLAGIDSEVVVEVAMVENFDAGAFKFDPSPMNSLRIGAPSGVSSESGVAHFDNIYLALEEATVDPPTLVGDYNGNGVVDAADYTIWRDTLGSTTDLRADGNGNNAIDASDLTVWEDNFGATLSASASAVPEPGTLAVLVLGSFAGLIAGRRR